MKDKRFLLITRAFLNAGLMQDGVCIRREEGTPQGGSGKSRSTGAAQNQRNLDLLAEHVTHFGGMVEKLIHADAEKIHKHQFRDGTRPAAAAPVASPMMVVFQRREFVSIS